MNENYIIDGNAVYEIDSGCVEVGAMSDETNDIGSLRGMDNICSSEHICNEIDKEDIDADDYRNMQGTVSVFF